jgi:predicted RNase H-like HicB family nuclease
VVANYSVVLEGDDASGYSAFTLDLPGIVVATGATRNECLSDMREAIAFHIECLRADGEPVPEPTTSPMTLVTVEVDTPAA